jgi:hypothetical protein
MVRQQIKNLQRKLGGSKLQSKSPEIHGLRPSKSPRLDNSKLESKFSVSKKHETQLSLGNFVV